MVGNLGENHHEIVRLHNLYKGRERNSKNASEIQEADFIHSETEDKIPKETIKKKKKSQTGKKSQQFPEQW